MARAGLSVKQRRFVREYVATGNGTRAALVAYATQSPATARSMAAENLAKPSVQAAVAELLDANGLSDRKLAEIHAHYLALYQSDDPQEKGLGLKALDMAYRLRGSYRVPEAETVESYAEHARQAYARRKGALASQQALTYEPVLPDAPEA